MTSSGKAKLAIWNGIKSGGERRFELWHSHAHLLQKRESGMLTFGARYVAESKSGPQYFTLYESNKAEAFGPSGYATPSPTVELDRSVREDFVDFVRGVFTIELSAGIGRTGFLATVGLVADSPEAGRAGWNAVFEQLVGSEGIVGAELCSYDHATTTSFVLRLKPLPTLPTAPWLLLLQGIDRHSLVEALDRLPKLLAEKSVPCRIVSAQIFMLQHGFQA
jgi:hypothetical protein